MITREKKLLWPFKKNNKTVFEYNNIGKKLTKKTEK